jgi:hypothetical protein
MKRLSILLIIAWLIPFLAKAQINITETFNSDDKLSFDWEEYADKKGSALVMDGQLVLTCKDKNSLRMVFVNLPLNVEADFKISSTLIVGNINDKDLFGVSIDNDDFVKLGFFMAEDFFYCGYYENSINYYGESTETTNALSIIEGQGKYKGEYKPIKLKGGKNQTVKTVLEKKGKKLIFSVNNVKVYEKPYKSNDFLVTPYLGFITTGNSVLKIDEVKVEQDAISNY